MITSDFLVVVVRHLQRLFVCLQTVAMTTVSPSQHLNGSHVIGSVQATLTTVTVATHYTQPKSTRNLTKKG